MPIFKDDYELALPKKWDISQKNIISLMDLDKLPFINCNPCDALDTLKLQLGMLDIQFQTRANIRTIEYAWQLVSAAVGTALLAKWQEIIDADTITFKPIQDINFLK